MIKQTDNIQKNLKTSVILFLLFFSIKITDLDVLPFLCGPSRA